MFLFRWGRNSTAIATQLNRNKSTISRELRRNVDAVLKYYSDESAQLRTIHRRQRASRRPRLKNERIQSYVLDKLDSGWSPEIISGRMKRDLVNDTISPEAIYQYIYHPTTPERDELIKCLRRAHRHRRTRHIGRQSHNTRITNRISIHERSAAVATRDEFGHWEGDSLVSSRSKAALCSLVERQSRLLKLARVRRRAAKKIQGAIVKQLGPLPELARQTLTLDNASEHVCHEQVTRTLGIKCYFCDPYSAWQRATNENMNGLIRWYFPKRTDFGRITQAEIERVELAINSRPRKCLDYRTPLEAAAPFVALQH